MRPKICWTLTWPVVFMVLEIRFIAFKEEYRSNLFEERVLSICAQHIYLRCAHGGRHLSLLMGGYLLNIQSKRHYFYSPNNLKKL